MGSAIVALRKESVDRNFTTSILLKFVKRSLSARRAWIEIFEYTQTAEKTQRSLSARRAWIEIRKELNLVAFKGCRSPQGERG